MPKRLPTDMYYGAWPIGRSYTLCEGSYLSLLEPQIEVSGGSYTVPRIVDGQQIAERVFYFQKQGPTKLQFLTARAQRERQER